MMLFIKYLQMGVAETSQTFTVNKIEAAKALLGLHGLAILVILLQEINVPIPLQVSAPVVFLALTFVSGGLVVLCVYTDLQLETKHLLYSLGISLICVMGIGFVLNVILPLVGYMTPMARPPLSVAVTVLNIILALVVVRRKGDEIVRVPLFPLLSPIPLSLLLLPLLSILSVELLNRTGNTTLLILILCIIALTPLAVITWKINKNYHVLGLWTLSLAVLYHKALWRNYGYGGQPYGIRTWNAKRWTPGVFNPDSLSAELLPNGILFPIYARLTGAHILVQYNVINPVLVSVIPVAIFITFRRYTDSYKAFLAASVFVFAHPFFRQYPAAGRSATPVLFLALFGVAISDRNSPRVVASALSLLFVLGIVVSHYGTSYYVMAALGGTVILLAALRWINALNKKTDGRELSFPEIKIFTKRSSSRITGSLVLFYSTATISWYMYIRSGHKFDLLPKHMRDSYLQFISGSTASGRTAARIQRDYGTESIQFAKYLYLLIGLLIVIGLIVIFYRYLSSEKTDFDDYYYALAVSFLGIFGSTIMVRTWGGGRPMMITYIFTLIFAVVGITAIEKYTLNKEWDALRLFGILLFALFILNSGVASALILGGFAPSNVPNEHSLAESPSPRAQTIIYRETDTAAHAWLINQHEDLEVYGDTFANRQADWYRPDITVRLEDTHSGWEDIPGKPLGLPKLAQPGVEPGYVLLLGHNLALEGVWNEQYEPQAASLNELELPFRDKVYTTGDSTIYYTNESIDRNSYPNY